MASKTVFTNDDGRQIEVSLDSEKKLHIAAGDFEDGAGITNGYVALDKEDVKELIKKLTELETQM